MSYHAPVPTQTRTPAPTPAEEAARRDGPAEAAPHRDRPAAGRLSAPERRASIARALAEGACIAGDALAQELGVSRQVIVQDIAVLRASGLDVVATVRGYLLAPGAAPAAPRRVIRVRHAPDEAVAELTALVDTGARVVDVVVAHPVYGELRADLDLRSRRDVRLWAERCVDTGARLLSELTDGDHVHTLEADHEPILDAAEDALRRLGFLVDPGR
jgi:transcriptional regulator of NAD metabolism